MAAMSGAAQADFTQRMQAGNWGGGVWVDNQTKEFRNCGLTLTLSGGTSVSVIVPANLFPALMVTDPKLQLTAKQPVQAKAKFGEGAEILINGTALSPTLIQFAMPAWPHNYDLMRNAKTLALTVPGLSTTLNIEGIAQAMPQAIGCAVRERVTLKAPPAVAPRGVPFEKVETTLIGLAVAERSGIGPYIVFADDKRPGNMQQAALVTGFAGAQGPGGTANILSTAYFIDAGAGLTNEAQKAALMARARSVDPKGVFGDLPGVPNKPNSVGLSMIGNGVYEEFYLVQKPGVGYFQFTTSTPLAGRATAEAAGAKLRAALALVVPY